MPRRSVTLLTVLALAAAALAAMVFASGTVVDVANKTDQTLNDVRVDFGRGIYRDIGSVPPGETVRVRLYESLGESEITLRHSGASWTGGYLEGGYHVSLEITPEGVNFDYVF